MSLLNIVNSPWAIAQEKLREIRAVYETHMKGPKIDIPAIQAAMGIEIDNRHADIEAHNGVAIIPVMGLLARRMNFFTMLFGGSSMDLIGEQFKTAVADESIHSIILLVDSPGGDAQGNSELSDLIFNAREQKPVIALANENMLSSAYWIGSAASEVLISAETALVGSIGVVAVHTDISKAEEMRGIKTTEITAGQFKRIASEHEPLTEEGREDIQEHIDALYTVFVEHVARNRDVDVETVLKSMADGKTFIGKQAIESGLVDGVSTLDDLINRLSGSGGDSAAGSATQTNFPGGKKAMSNSNQPGETGQALVTAASVKTANPDVYEAIKAEGYESGLKEGKASELKRIQDVKAQSMLGHEKLVETLMFDGTTSGDQAAGKVLAAERTMLEAKATAIEADAPQPVTQADAAPTSEPDLSALSDDERCKAQWDKDEKLRAEFPSLGAYTAYMKAKANGQAKILNSKA